MCRSYSGLAARRCRRTNAIPPASVRTARMLHQVVESGTTAKLMARMREPTITMEMMPPRLSTAPFDSLTWAGTKNQAMKNATAASGTVTRKTEPQSNSCSRTRRAAGRATRWPRRSPTRGRWPACAWHRPTARRSAPAWSGRPCRRRCRRGPARRRAPRWSGRTPRAAERDGRHRAHQQHELAPVAVAQCAEIEDGCREPETVADRGQVQLRLRGIECLPDRRQGDVRHREVEVRDRRREDQCDEDEHFPRRAVCLGLRRCGLRALPAPLPMACCLS